MNDTMTAHELSKWVDRLKSIAKGPKLLKNKRLTHMIFDMERCYGIPRYNNQAYFEAYPSIAFVYLGAVDELNSCGQI